MSFPISLESCIPQLAPRGEFPTSIEPFIFLRGRKPACRRDSVRTPCPGEGQRTGVAIHLSGLPGERPFSGTRRAACLPRLALLRVGFTEPAKLPSPLVRSYRTVSPLPVRAGDPQPAIGGFLSVALSCESPRLASPAPCSSESRPSSTRSRLAPARLPSTFLLRSPRPALCYRPLLTLLPDLSIRPNFYMLSRSK